MIGHVKGALRVTCRRFQLPFQDNDPQASVAGGWEPGNGGVDHAKTRLCLDRVLMSHKMIIDKGVISCAFWGHGQGD